MIRKTVLAAILLVAIGFLSGGVVQAQTTYYVKTGGSDAADGLSDATAWATISKVNSLTFSPGDGILFRRGDIWRETLKVPSSGTADNYITFGAYGTGDRPKILGSVQATDWTETAANIWRSSTTVTDPYGWMFESEIWFEKTDGSVTWGNPKKDPPIANLTEEYDWTWDANSIYVYAESNPDSRYAAVEIPQRGTTINMNRKEYIEIDGFLLFYAMASGVNEVYRTQDLHGFIIRNCEIAYNGIKDGVGFGTHVMYSDSLIENNVIHDCGRRAISLYNYGDPGVDISNIIVQNNTLYNGCHTTGVDISAGSIREAHGNVDNIVIRNNLIYDDPNKDLEGGVGGLHSELNYLSANDPKKATVTNIYFYNNIFKHPSGAAIHLNNIDGFYVYNNVFYGHNQLTTQNNFHIHAHGSASSGVLKNNIFYGNARQDVDNTAILVYLSSGMSHEDVEADHNLYWQEDQRLRLVQRSIAGQWLPGKLIFWTEHWSDLQTVWGWELNSPDPADPLFVAPENNDFRLQPGSPAIGAGIAIPGITQEIEGGISGNPPNIGCHGTVGRRPK